MAFDHIIASHPILKNLAPAQVGLVSRLSREVSFVRRETVYREGEVGAGVFLVISGYVKLTKCSYGGKEQLMGLAGPDDIFGHCCQPVAPCPSPCLATARSRVKLILLPTNSWQWLLANEPRIAHVYMQALLESRRTCMELVTDLSFLELEGRLAKLLLQLTRWSHTKNGGAIEVPKILSQWELASALGTVREVVTRKLEVLVKSGALARNGRQIIIQDRKALESWIRP